MGSLLRPGETRGIQQNVVGIGSQIPGGSSTRRPYGSGLRSRRKISCVRESSERARLSGAHFAIPVPAGVLPRGRILRAPASLLDLRQQTSRRQVKQDAIAGRKQTLARGAGSFDRPETTGRERAGRLFRAAKNLAGRTK